MSPITCQAINRRGSGIYFRSNRPLTEFACANLDLFLVGYSKNSQQFSNGNTAVFIEVEKTTAVFRVTLFGEEILNVLKSDGKVVSVKVGFTSFYDRFGQPTNTTAERLNGLLDRLGIYGVLPKKTRVFRDQEQRITYLGKGDNRITVNKGYVNHVYIRPNNTELDIAGSFLDEGPL